MKNYYKQFLVDEKEIENIVAQLTLDEKIAMIHGNGIFRTEPVERLQIPMLKMSDGPMGVRRELPNDSWEITDRSDDFVSYLPSNSALAATWNRVLANEAGSVLGEETRGRGKDVILAPGINIKRTPLCGRNFEYMSEDPVLTKELAVEMVIGIQKNDVAACSKHFAANAQETDRMWVDTIVDERTLNEIYFPAFKAMVEAGTYSMMGAYNKLNGYHCCENKDLLDTVLRDNWKFDGVVISDWCAVHKTKEAAEASLDIEMATTPDFDEYFLANPLKEAILKGEISELHINAKVKNIIRLMYRLKMMGSKRHERSKGCYNTATHQSSVRNVAEESIVLLKNQEKRLPINEIKLQKIGVIGLNAMQLHANGGGSAQIKALYEISPLMGMKMILGGEVEFLYSQGYYVPSVDDSIEVVEEKQKKFLQEAIMIAGQCEQTIFVGGLSHEQDVEGQDRSHLMLPYNQDSCIEAILQANSKAVIVLIGGSPVEMPWREKASAIVWSYYSGMEGGVALAKILFGQVNPSGKLPETFPNKLEDCAVSKSGQFATEGRVTYTEGIYVGYRYYDKEGIKPAYSFGHGLSYTEFTYEEMHITKMDSSKIKVAISLTNSGDLIGKEVVQIYVMNSIGAIDRPVKELRGFAKIELAPNETTEVVVELGEDAFSYYSSEKHEFVVEKGEYKILAGSSTEDIRLVQKYTI